MIPWRSWRSRRDSLRDVFSTHQVSDSVLLASASAFSSSLGQASNAGVLDSQGFLQWEQIAF